MIFLKEIDKNNFDDCINLERKSQRFVGDAEAVLAEAYIYRDFSSAFGIYNDDIMVGMVIIAEKSDDNIYSFTDLFIADPFQGNGYGKKAVAAIISKLKEKTNASFIEIQVHKTNTIAIKIYEENGFQITKKTACHPDFWVMQLPL